MSHFFAYLSRMKLIQRWSLMRSNTPENVQEHSLRVAQIAHVLVVMHNEEVPEEAELDPAYAALMGIYHDASEVLTGDLPSPIKYFSPEIKKAYHKIEDRASRTLLNLLPDHLQPSFELLLLPPAQSPYLPFIKAADKLCAWLKCLEELNSGNREFAKAKEALEESIRANPMACVARFVECFSPSFTLTLDEMS